MASKLFVGNLSYSTDSDKLQQLFAEFGSVVSATVITDRETGRSRGFGFVEYASEDEANKAIAALNDKEIEGRPLSVSIARPPQNRN